MYSYDRRQASHPRTYVEAIQQAEKAYGIKRGLLPKAAEARRIAKDLDRAVKDYQGLNPDDAWAGDRGKLDRLWRELQKLFDVLFGYNPPPLDAWL